jgi:hypothetical protein
MRESRFRQRGRRLLTFVDDPGLTHRRHRGRVEAQLTQHGLGVLAEGGDRVEPQVPVG